MKLNILKDLLKNRFVEFALKFDDRLYTYTTMIVEIIKAYNELPENLVCLDLFGKYGLQVTKFYCKYCAYLEIYEINRYDFRYLKKFIKGGNIGGGGDKQYKYFNKDSIIAVKNRELLLQKYNFVCIDNPAVINPYGENYYEHFDLFPYLIDYLDQRCILVINFVFDIYKLRLTEQHLKARIMFYGKVDPTIDEGLAVYAKIFKNNNREILKFFFIPKYSGIGHLIFVIK